jgi:hypothetical protein
MRLVLMSVLAISGMRLVLMSVFANLETNHITIGLVATKHGVEHT